MENEVKAISGHSIRSAMTRKQVMIMKVIAEGNGKDLDGNLIPVDIDQILERIGYKTTKESMHFSLRAMIRNGWIKKGGTVRRRQRRRTVYYPTELGAQMVGNTQPVPDYIEPVPSHSDASFQINELIEEF